MIKKSTVAGILIGLGVIINIQSDIPQLGALLFSFGLLTIINMQLPLFTGKVGYLAPDLHLILLFNFIGIGITVGLYIVGNPYFYEYLFNASTFKFAKDPLMLFINACFCGALIHFAVRNKKTILTVFAVMIFILIGAEHCIADFPYFLCNISAINAFKMLLIIGGNSVGAIIIEKLLCGDEKNEQIRGTNTQ